MVEGEVADTDGEDGANDGGGRARPQGGGGGGC